MYTCVHVCEYVCMYVCEDMCEVRMYMWQSQVENEHYST